MEFGLYVNPQFPDDTPLAAATENMVAQVRAAREAGFSSIIAPHHYLTQPLRMFQANILLARLAAEAGNMRMGPGVWLLGMTNPVQVAEESATLDWICNGGYILAVGLGYREAEFEAFGANFRQRAARMTEAIEVVRRLWSEERVSHKGQFFQLTDVGASVRPRNGSSLPLWIGASVEPAIRRAARVADAWLSSPSADWQQLERNYRIYDEERAAAGLEPATEKPMIRECFVATTAEQAMAIAREPLIYKYSAYASWGNANVAGRPFREAFDDFQAARFIIGDKAMVKDRVQWLNEKLGVNHLVVRLQWPGLAQKDVLKAIDLIGEIKGELK
jgi:alkanesulfonate monooxygenase SsuD/methylene tetrahydromethanopterin reductase-like flavin-dependent oxidoreductase (luciferase family)